MCCCDIDDCCDVFLKFIEPISLVVLLSIGIPLWVVGGKTKTKDMFPTILSLPLFPIEDVFPTNKYYIKDNSTTSDNVDISIHLNNDNIKNKDVYIFHNMWGFNITASLVVNQVTISKTETTQNSNISNPDTTLQRYSIQSLPEIGKSLEKNHIYHNTFNVYCPINTQITQINNVQDYCKSNPSPMRFDGRYSSNILFPSFKSKYFNELSLKFDQSYLIPYTYNDPPEAYILFCGGNFKKSMYYAGMTLTIIGIIAFVVYAILDIVLLCLYL